MQINILQIIVIIGENDDFVVVADNGKEILSMNEVLSYMLRSSKMLCDETELSNLLKLDESEWQNYVGEVRGMIVTYPGMVRKHVHVHVAKWHISFSSRTVSWRVSLSCPYPVNVSRMMPSGVEL